MKLAILGASAGVGLAAVQVALERGHDVTTLSRRTNTLPQHARLTPLAGSATDAADLRRALTGADATLVCLGTGKSIQPTTLYTDFTTALFKVRDAVGTQTLVVLTGFGAGDSAAFHGPVVGPLFRFFLGAVYADKTAMENRLIASDLRWVLVRPGVLTDGTPSRPARVFLDYTRGMPVRFVTRRAVAQFMVEQAEQPSALGRKPALTG